LESHINKIYTR